MTTPPPWFKKSFRAVASGGVNWATLHSTTTSKLASSRWKSCDSGMTSTRIGRGCPGDSSRRRECLRQIVGLGLVGLGLEMAVDQEDVERFPDRHHHVPPVVKRQGIVIDRNFHQMVARGRELKREDGRHVFAGRQVERFFGPEPAVDRQPRTNTVRRRAAEIVQAPCESIAVVPTDTNGAASLRSVTARFSPPVLPRSITTQRDPAVLDAREQMLEPVRRPPLSGASSRPANRSRTQPLSG